jgi:hypothetical protein
MDSPKMMVKYINCLSILEEKTALLYKHLSEKAVVPLIKSLLLSISKDSSKHSILLKGIAGSISSSKQKSKDCIKNLGEVWNTVQSLLNEASKEKSLDVLLLPEMLPSLDALERSLGEEYYIFVQMKTLQLLVREIKQIYTIDFKSVWKVFDSIVKDEMHHREILATIKAIIEKDSAEQESTPKVEYQNPDSWIRPLPPATYDSK